MRSYRKCAFCIMDTTDPDIQFDERGYCNHCRAALSRIAKQLLPTAQRIVILQEIAHKIREDGKGKEYDCVIGVSGGVDSTATAYLVKRQLGLRPLAVHFDNGWDTELAVDNINRTLNALEIELFTHVVDWEEFRDIQLSFLKASVPNAEIPTDHGINALLPKVALENSLRYVLSGSNIATESIMPIAWGHYSHDLRHLCDIQENHGTKKIKTLPTIALFDYMYYFIIRRMRQVPILNYIEYDRDEWKRRLKEEIGWRDYGGKHYESVWTRFFQGYYLPTKFGFDKRLAHLSSAICSELITREEALEIMKEPVYPENMLREDRDFVLKKFGLTEEEFERIMSEPAARHTDYKSNYFLFHRLQRFKNIFRAIATSV